MLRDRNLVPLSRQHQHALALCVRIERALAARPTEVEKWQAEAARDFEQEIQFHFAAEEKILFPGARRFAELKALVDVLMEEHGRLRGYFARAKTGAMNAAELIDFTKLLSSHIRKEERQLFEALQALLSPDDLAALGAGLERALHDAAPMCRMPGPVDT